MAKIQKFLFSLGIGFFVFGVSLSLSASSLLDHLNQNLEKHLYKERPISSEEIIILGIDENSLKSFSEGGLGNFGDWPSSYYSQVFANLEAAGASVIMLDVLFSEASIGISAKELYELYTEHLGDEMGFTEASLAYLSAPHPADEDLAETLKKYENIYLIEANASDPYLEENIIHYSNRLAPISIIQESTKTGNANVNINTSSAISESVNSLPIVLNIEGELEEHISLKLFRAHTGNKTQGTLTENNQAYDIGLKKTVPLEDGMMLVNYARKPHAWPSVSFSDVYYGNFDPKEFAGKIVLIGPTSPRFHDYFYTPIDTGTPMPGIEIHANAIQTLMDEAFLEYQDFVPFATILAGILLISVSAFMFLPIWGGLLVLALEIVLFPFYAQWRFDKGVIINLIWPVFAMVASYFLVMAYRNITEFREKRKLRNAFAHYVSPELVNEISNSEKELALGGERRVMSTLFLDIENFTTLSEKLEAQEVVRVINFYFDAFAKEIMAHGGTVDKFEGDAIMALFGAPIKSEDHALKACETAMAVRSRVTELNQVSGHNLNVRVGIATGECIVGNMGSEQRFDYTAMGDTVNTASRLEGGNKFYGTRILVNPKTMEAAQEQLFFRRIDRVRLKGKEEAIDIYELMGRRDAVSEAGVQMVSEWHSALDHYRNQDWDTAEAKIRGVLEKLPEDGPSKTYLERIQMLRMYPPSDWDGTWSFSSK